MTPIQQFVECKPDEPTLQAILAAELFSQIPTPAQDELIDLIKSLLADG